MELSLEQKIRNKALELGYENCGIIPISDMKEYEEKLEERMRKFPECEPILKSFYRFSNFDEIAPWAKSIVICVRNHANYKIPPHLNGLIGKSYLVDLRIDENCKDYKDGINFKNYLDELGIKNITDRKFGLTALRWAAMKAGLGIVRKNNFFYTESGSYVFLEAFIIDKELTLKHENNLKKCPTNCNLCINSCPTKALSEPYTMNMGMCVSFINTMSPLNTMDEPLRDKLGTWIFGCDACQDACPFNKKAFLEKDDFPNLDYIASLISVEKIIEMDYEVLRNVISPKFWYISPDNVWKWKTNALNYMLNNYEPKYDKYIEIACSDEDENARKMALWVKEQIKK